MHPLLFMPLLMVFFFFSTAGMAEETLSIGVEKQRKPYVYLDDKKQVKGILITEVKALCYALDIKCNFIIGDIQGMLADLRDFKLNAVLIIDSFLMPKAEKIKFSSSLCETTPVFVQKETTPLRKKPEDYSGTIIGAKYGSLLHVHLLEHYSSFAQLKTYSRLESGVFDLVSERVDVLFTEQVFFNARVLETPLGNKNNPSKLIASPLDITLAFNTKMALGFRASDSELLDKIKAHQALSKTKPCTSLLQTFLFRTFHRY